MSRVRTHEPAQRASVRTGLVLAVAALGLFLATSTARAQVTYTFNKANGSWTQANNWTPSRNTLAASDILVFDGATTPTSTATAVPTQTIGRLRIINNCQATFNASAAVTLTITGGALPNLEILGGSSLTLGGASAITIQLGSGATADITGTMTLTGGAHRLLANSASSITMNSGSNFVTGTGFTGNAFGNSGTANVATFGNGSTYTHNAGSDPFGLTAPSSKITFQNGSTATFRSNSGFSTGGRTYYDIRVQNNTALSGSASSNLIFHTLTVESGSSFNGTGSGAASVTVNGDITSAGTGAITLGAGSGGIIFNTGGTQLVGTGGGTGTVTFASAATVAFGTTLAASRTLTFSAGALTVNGTFRIDGGSGSTGPTNFTYGAGATLVFNSSSSVAVSSGSTFWPAASGPTNVNVQGWDPLESTCRHASLSIL